MPTSLTWSVLHFIWALQHNNPWWDHSTDCARYTTIPDEITALIVPDIPHLQSELYKLNIYGAPGGHFKAHVDTPRSEQMFGSPVVCLPTCFSGGALVTHHHQQEVNSDWSSSSESPMQKLSWAAFFCDVEHEVLPVTAGYRITLTYNLYSHKSPVSTLLPSLYITTSPLYIESYVQLWATPSLCMMAVSWDSVVTMCMSLISSTLTLTCRCRYCLQQWCIRDNFLSSCLYFGWCTKVGPEAPAVCKHTTRRRKPGKQQWRRWWHRY